MSKITHPYSVSRADGHLLNNGKKRKRFTGFALAADYAASQGQGVECVVDTEHVRYSVTQKPQEKIVADGLYIDKRSATRSEVVHHVYTGDNVNSPMCTCEGYHHGTIIPNILYTCTHIRQVVYGEEK